MRYKVQAKSSITQNNKHGIKVIHLARIKRSHAHMLKQKKVLSCQPRVTATQYFVYNCLVEH